MKLRCHKCGHIDTPTLKMGGLICPRCRVIIKYPGSTEYKLMFDKMKLKP